MSTIPRMGSYWAFTQDDALDAVKDFREELINKHRMREQTARVMAAGVMLYLCSDAVKARKMIMHPEIYEAVIKSSDKPADKGEVA